MSTTEFSRLFELERVRRKPIKDTLTAAQTECTALANRFSIISVESIEADIVFEEEAPHWFRLQGRLTAKVVQRCIRTLEPLSESIDEPIDVRITDDPEFKRHGQSDDDGLELSSGDDYEYVGEDSVDVGELLTQLLSTAMEPYPRKDEKDLPEYAGVEVVWNSDDKQATDQDVRTRPFAGLADLLAGKDDNS